MKYSCLTLIFIVLFFTLGQQQAAQQLIKQGWEFQQPNNWTDWKKASIPSTIHLDLLLNNIIQDPYYGDNQMKMYWIEPLDWVYRTSFDLDPKQGMQYYSNLKIVFEGLDTHADVYLNKQLILKANNQHRKWIVALKRSQLLDKSNNLTIYFHSATTHDIQYDAMVKAQYNVSLPSNWTYSRKAAYQYGWDWGPRLVTCGIWKDVYLQGYNKTLFDSILIRTMDLKSGQADMRAQIGFRVQQYGKYQVDIENLNTSIKTSVPITLSQQQIDANIDWVEQNPKLWWVRNIGTPYLYTYRFELRQNNTVIDFQIIRTGIKQVKVLQINDTTGNGSSFMVNLNGKNVYMKGGKFMPRALKNPGIYSKTIQNAVDGNFNMLRLWGGGQYEYDIFYDKCDEAGLLVWHDMMFACNLYVGNEDWMQNIGQETIDNVLRLRNHPSIALWNGNNEVLIGWEEWGWQTNLTVIQKQTIQEWYDNIFNKLLPAVLSKIDPDRFYWPTSPTQSSSYNTTGTISSGDIHYWQVWAGRQYIETYNQFVGRFNSEYGMQSMPPMVSIKKFVKPQDQNLQSFVMQLHERGDNYWTKLGFYQTTYYGLNFTERTIPFEQYVYTSQVMQSYAVSIAIEALRRSKPWNMGSLYWQLNDVWPVTSWASVDYYNEWKALQYAARHLYKNIMLSVSPEADQQGNHAVYIVNDFLAQVTGELVIDLNDFNNSKPQQILLNVTIQEGESRLAYNITKKVLSAYTYDNLYIKTTLRNTNQNQDFNNTFIYGRPLNWKLQDPKLEITYDHTNVTTNILYVKAQKFAKSVYLYLDDYSSGLTPDHNYFDIECQNVRPITIRGFKVKDIITKLRVTSLYDVVSKKQSEILEQHYQEFIPPKENKFLSIIQ